MTGMRSESPSKLAGSASPSKSRKARTRMRSMEYSVQTDASVAAMYGGKARTGSGKSPAKSRTRTRSVHLQLKTGSGAGASPARSGTASGLTLRTKSPQKSPISSLDERARFRRTELKYGSALKPAKRTLPLGKRATKELSQRNPEREIAVIKPVDPDEERQKQKQLTKRVDVWKVKKKTEAAARAKAQKAAAKEHRAMVLQLEQADSANKAFGEWVQRKADAVKRGKMKGDAKLGAITISEFLCAWRRSALGDVATLLAYRQLLLLLENPSKKGVINPDKFFRMIYEVEIQLLVDQAKAALVAKMQSERVNDGAKITPDEIQKARKEKVQMGLGKQILATISPTRSVFGDNLRTINDLFRSLDEDGSGTLDPKEFKDGMKRIDLGINSTQQVELMKMFDTDKSGSIDYSEFETFLIKCKAAAELDTTHIPTATFDAAWEIAAMNEFDTDQCRQQFEEAMLSVHETRVYRSQNPSKNGFVTASQLKNRLVQNDLPGSPFGMLSLMQRKDLISAFDQAYKLYSRKPELQLFAKQKKGVSVDDIDLFMMKAVERHHERSQEDLMDPIDKKKEDTRFRACRKLIKVAHLQRFSFEQLMSLLVNKSRPYLVKDAETRPTREFATTGFKKYINLLKLGISEVASDDLVKLFTESRLEVDPKWSIHSVAVEYINLDTFLKTLRNAQARNTKIARWAEDPRSRICDDIIRNIPGHALIPALDQLYRQLVDDQLHQLDMAAANAALEAQAEAGAATYGERRASMVSRHGSLVDGEPAAIKYEPAGGPQDTAFDATFCPPDMDVVMPPGSQPPCEHLTLSGHATKEILDLL